MKQLLDDVQSWINQRDKRVIIGVSGHGAAGKSTFANELKIRMKLDNVNVLGTDPYIINSEIRNKTRLTYHYENEEHHYKMTACHPAAHHLPSLERDIQMIRDGIGFYTIDTHYAKSEWMSPEKQITIVEGMSAAFINPDAFDLKIYFYTDGETEFQRRSIRDINERGRDINQLRLSHNERRIQYELFMHPYHQHFDIIVKNSKEVAFLNTFISSSLK